MLQSVQFSPMNNVGQEIVVLQSVVDVDLFIIDGQRASLDTALLHLNTLVGEIGYCDEKCILRILQQDARETLVQKHRECARPPSALS